MSPKEISAYRELLADAVILIRGYSGPAYQKSGESSQDALRHVNALADLFHNVARHSQEDFKEFEPEHFWRLFRHYRSDIPEMSNFELTFQKYLDKKET